MIRQAQLDGLLEASKHNLIAGLIVNYRNKDNDTFFVPINIFMNMITSINKKSFNVKDLEEYKAIRIDSFKKRTRFSYNIEKLIQETRIK